MAPNALHARVFGLAQPNRLAKDVFPTAYKLNATRVLRRYFPPSEFDHYSCAWSPEPAYHMNSRALSCFWLACQYLQRPFLGGEFLLAFIRKIDRA
jgi:hypothetical protein